MSWARLEDWSLRGDARPRLAGIVSGHPDHADGTRVATSRVTFLDREALDKALTASGTFYRLGRPERTWVELLEREGRDSAILLRRRLEA